MANLRTAPGSPVLKWSALLLSGLAMLAPGVARGQMANPVASQLPEVIPTPAPLAAEQPAEEMVVDVRVVGNRAVTIDKIQPHVHTRKGRPFSAKTVEDDVRRLNKTKLFVEIRPVYQQVPGGRIVIFQVVERPIMQHVYYVGTKKIKKKLLAKETGLKEGDALDPFAIEEGRRKIEEYYRTHGFGKVRVSIEKGTNPTDRDVVYSIDEGPKAKIAWTSFVGNTITDDARLRTQVKSKPGILWIFKGDVDQSEIDEDLNRLTAYYRGLGFFRARVGRELQYSQSGEWLRLTYVIDEGPRYAVRNISILGNKKISTAKLAENLKLKAGEYFNQDKMTADVGSIEDEYGSVGYVFANVEADPRFLEQPGQLDLVYKITEGHRYRVGRINVEIKGEYPHTQLTTVLNRMSLQPGDIVDIRELRASERRMRASQLFEVNPAQGTVPTIAFSPREDEEAEAKMASRRPKRTETTRFQSPEPDPYAAQRPYPAAEDDSTDRLLDVTLRGQWATQPDGGGQ